MHAVARQDQTEEGCTSRGRPLDATRDAALRQAALELLAEIGYDRLTMDSVAARARASKATLYRRWCGKAELVVDALGGLKGAPCVPDTGSLQGDLEAVAAGSTGVDDRFHAQVMLGLITALAHDGELREVFRARLIEPRMAGMRQVLERAAARGEVDGERDLDLVVSLFPALVFHRLLTTGEVPDREFTARVMHDVILPLATAPATAPAHR